MEYLFNLSPGLLSGNIPLRNLTDTKMEININPDEIEKRLAKRRAQKAGIPLKSSEPIIEAPDDSPLEHYLTPKVRAIMHTRENPWLTGPAGSGKSKCVELVAKSMELPMYAPPIGRETTNAQLFGYFNAAGEYVRTPIRQAVEFGGIIHLEEIDFASAAVGTALNALLANDAIGFPDATIPKHKDCILVASANTYGTGSNAQYIGSNGLNAATLNRFVFLDFPYDERLERRITTSKEWTSYTILIRAKIAKLGLKHIVSPRQSIQGGKLISTGMFSWEEIEQMVLFKGLDPLTISKIKDTQLD